MSRAEQLFAALSDVGIDLIDMAQTRRFSKSPWRTVLGTAACAAVILSAALFLHRQPQVDPPAEVLPPPVIEIVEEIPPVELPPVETRTEEPEEYAPYTTELKSLPFYVFDPDPERDDTPSKAIAADGSVLLEVDSGRIEPLKDEATGEYLAILVIHSRTADHDSYYDIYNLEGGKIAGMLQAYNIQCFGSLVMILDDMGGEYTASLYGREHSDLLRSDFHTGMLVGDCLWMTPKNSDGQTHFLYDSEGNLTELHDTPIATYFLWQNRTYFVTGTEDTGYGLMDSKGNLLIQKDYRNILGISGGYARCVKETGECLVDIATGEAVFQWPHPILQVCGAYILVHTADYRYQLIDWEGHVVLDADTVIHTMDDNQDELPEAYFHTWQLQPTFTDADGHTLQILDKSDNAAGVNILNSHTAVLLHQRTDGYLDISLLHFRTGEETRLPERNYATYYPLLEDNRNTGMFVVSYWEGDPTAPAAEEGSALQQGVAIFRDDGTLVLDGLSDLWSRQGDVFYTEQDGMAGLIRIDGTWLYQEPLIE